MTHTTMCRHGPQCISATVQANCGKAGVCQTHTSRLQIATTRLWRIARDPLRAAQAVPTSRWRACAAHTSAARTLPHLRFTAHLVAGVVHQDVDPVKVLDSLVHDLPASARSMHQGHYRSTRRSSRRPAVCIKVKHPVSARQRLHVQQNNYHTDAHVRGIQHTALHHTAHGTDARYLLARLVLGQIARHQHRLAASLLDHPLRLLRACHHVLEMCIAAIAIHSSCDAGMGILYKRSNRPNSSPHSAECANQAPRTLLS
jgi:hypothetical protein